MLAVGEAPNPVAGAGEVVIEVAVADVLFLDTQLRSGWGREYFDHEPPYVPGSGRSAWWPGQRGWRGCRDGLACRRRQRWSRPARPR